MNRLQTSLIAFLAILPAGAMAQTTVTDLDDIVVTANRAPYELARTGVSVVALSAQDLKSTATVAESLSRQGQATAAAEARTRFERAWATADVVLSGSRF